MSGATDETSLEYLTAGLKAAMRRMPGAVALITTCDPDSGEAAGLAATAVIPVSMDPPSMLVAINRSASAHSVIERSGRFCVNLLGTSHTDLVGVFSNSEMRGQRFASSEWDYVDGIPYLRESCASIFCEVATTLLHGTHELFIGNVYRVANGGIEGEPLGWIEGGFARMGKIM